MATPVYEPGKFANYIAPPLRGINRQPINFEYVQDRGVKQCADCHRMADCGIRTIGRLAIGLLDSGSAAC